jgi:hypothetical protein
MVSVKAAPPAMAMAGLKLAIVGGCGMVVKTAPEEMAPSVLMVTLDWPALAIRLAGTMAVSCVEVTYVVASVLVPHKALEPEVKFEPLMVSVKAVPPATAEAGLRLSTTGGGWRIVKAAPEEFPLMSLTVMLAVPVLAIKLAGTAAVNCVAPP